MSKLKPGKFRITKKAMDTWDLPKGAEVLDIGCGRGETLEYLEEEYGFKGSGIDLSMALVKEGKTRNPNLNIKYGDGEFLDDFTSYTFDGVMMECVLSLINKPDEALHEAYCVLKKGGRLFISDLYIKNPETEFMRALAIEAERQRKKPHKEGECGDECAEEHKNRAIEFRSSGRFLLEPLMDQLKEIGYKNIHWEDCSLELDNYVAEMLMNEGSINPCFCKEACTPDDKYKTGYFMLTAEKPV